MFFFAQNSPLLRKSGGEKMKKEDNCEGFYFSCKRNKNYQCIQDFNIEICKLNKTSKQRKKNDQN